MGPPTSLPAGTSWLSTPIKAMDATKHGMPTLGLDAAAFFGRMDRYEEKIKEARRIGSFTSLWNHFFNSRSASLSKTENV